MTRTTILLSAAALAAMAAATAGAQEADPAIDVNGDGMYSFPEVQAALPEMTEETFTVLDTSGDGLLDADEIAAGVEAGMLPVTEG